ncbi:hypothetical protein [Acidimangrovimonas pyrenivorans]|uniref:Uncharacterized protein n=1 Tax=Acidimangrovimonas pyrenivorans TaxID=2030798 RepID=A0ABV7ALL1_9RHOB
MATAFKPWKSRQSFLSTASTLWLLGGFAVAMMVVTTYHMLIWTGTYRVEPPPGLAVGKGAAGGAIARVSCRNIGAIPQDVLTSWVLGYWNGANPQALRADPPFMTPKKAGAAVMYACLATPDATIRAAVSEALAKMPGLSADRAALRDQS